MHSSGPDADTGRLWESVVVGAGQAGLSASFHLQRRGVAHVVLDAETGPGGAWQHRWDSLTMRDVHRVAALPDDDPAPVSDERANRAVPATFDAYERRHQLPIRRPVRVDRVHDETGEVGVLAVETDAGTWRTRTLVNATGTWSQPYWPAYPGRERFEGLQLHTHDYRGPEPLRGRRTVVVGGGASAVQLLGEIALVTDTLWVTRREPVWRTEPFTEELGREVVARVEARVRQGLPPMSVVGETGVALREQEQAAAALGAYQRLPMFARIEPDAVVWADGRREPVDAIVWATGFRPAIAHLAPLHLRTPAGGVVLEGTTAVADPRVQLVGYGPSASTIGANRAGRVAARGVVDSLTSRGREPAPAGR